jgi:hypothetical protein
VISEGHAGLKIQKDAVFAMRLAFTPETAGIIATLLSSCVNISISPLRLVPLA